MTSRLPVQAEAGDDANYVAAQTSPFWAKIWNRHNASMAMREIEPYIFDPESDSELEVHKGQRRKAHTRSIEVTFELDQTKEESPVKYYEDDEISEEEEDDDDDDASSDEDWVPQRKIEVETAEVKGNSSSDEEIVIDKGSSLTLRTGRNSRNVRMELCDIESFIFDPDVKSELEVHNGQQWKDCVSDTDRSIYWVQNGNELRPQYRTTSPHHTGRIEVTFEVDQTKEDYDEEDETSEEEGGTTVAEAGDDDLEDGDSDRHGTGPPKLSPGTFQGTTLFF
uniref:Uncharacterized protein n=1 Tax=Knipowitschia caucasica TaxID=637954 RepID=A0AAV2JQ72_KNICA